MDEKLETKKLFAGEKKPSMKRRAEGHGYKERRMYMITLEVAGRQPLLGNVVGDAFAEEGAIDGPAFVPSPLGEAVEREWMGIPRYYPQITVVACQLMPDHMHGILFIREQLPVHLSQVIIGFKTGCNRILRRMLAATQPQPTEKPVSLYPPSSQAAALLSSYPQAAAVSPQSSHMSPLQQPAGIHLWAEGYNDLILRRYDELSIWKNYLRDNPRRLLMKRARPDWLRPHFGISIGSYCCSAIGNLALLTAPTRLQVRLSRRLTPEQIAAEKNRLLALAHEGAVLVSPSISPGEKAVMRAAFDAHFPLIVIVENGFTELSKPHGEQFYACAEGRLLLLSPWSHHNESLPLTAQQCQAMNLLATTIERLPLAQ